MTEDIDSANLTLEPNADTLNDWTSDSIIGELRKLGVDTDRTRFADQIQKAKDPRTLRSKWKGRKTKLSLWDEFLLSAAIELQHRLTAERPCIETAVKTLVDAIDVVSENQVQPPSEALHAIIPAAMPLVAYLESFTSDQRAQKYQIALGSEVLSQAAPEFASTILPLVPAALYNAGRWYEALIRLEPCLERFPGHLPTILAVGRLYDAMHEDKFALDAYRLGLARASLAAEWRVFRDRTVDLLERMGREESWEYIEGLAPCPPDTFSSSKRAHPKLKYRKTTPDVAASVVSTLYRAVDKAGANDPCPCGSGKKYKRCCRR